MEEGVVHKVNSYIKTENFPSYCRIRIHVMEIIFDGGSPLQLLEVFLFLLLFVLYCGLLRFGTGRSPAATHFGDQLKEAGMIIK